MPQHARTWARWLTRKVGVILPQPRPFPESVAVGGNGPGDRLRRSSQSSTFISGATASKAPLHPRRFASDGHAAELGRSAAGPWNRAKPLSASSTRRLAACRPAASDCDGSRASRMPRVIPSAPRLRPDDSCHDRPEIEPGSAIREPVFQQDAAARSHMGEVADAEGWGHSTSTEAFPGVRRRRRERPRRPFAAVEPVEHFHQRRDRPDVALGDELASSALNLAKANPRLRPLHLVVRETEFCGLRLAGYFRRRMRENSRNSVRRPRCASLTRRNYGVSVYPETAPVCRDCMVADAVPRNRSPTAALPGNREKNRESRRKSRVRRLSIATKTARVPFGVTGSGAGRHAILLPMLFWVGLASGPSKTRGPKRKSDQQFNRKGRLSL